MMELNFQKDKETASHIVSDLKRLAFWRKRKRYAEQLETNSDGAFPVIYKGNFGFAYPIDKGIPSNFGPRPDIEYARKANAEIEYLENKLSEDKLGTTLEKIAFGWYSFSQMHQVIDDFTGNELNRLYVLKNDVEIFIEDFISRIGRGFLDGINSIEQISIDEPTSQDLKYGEEMISKFSDLVDKRIEKVENQNTSVGKKKIGNSNRDVLAQSEEWMVPLVNEIVELELPTDEQVSEIFDQHYPGFSLEFKKSSLKTPLFAKGADLEKKSISIALRFIFKQKHPDGEITWDAIYRRYLKGN